MRLSSATSVFAPWPAAMRAARTPPDPAPMTKKSTSNAIDFPASVPRPETPRLLEIEPFFFISSRARSRMSVDSFSRQAPVTSESF